MNFNFLNLEYLRDKFSVDLDVGKTDFIEKFKISIDDDKGYLTDLFFGSKKDYLGEINSNGFFLRKKRNFSGPFFSTNAKGKIFEEEGRNTRLEIEIRAYDAFTRLGLILTPIVFLILITIIVAKEAYPALIVVIPISILFVILQRILGRKTIDTFRTQLIKNFSKLG